MFELPRQLPSGFTAEELAKTIETYAKGGLWVIIISTVIQILLKSSMDIVIELYCSLQILKMISIFLIHIPANLSISLTEIRKVIDFE